LAEPWGVLEGWLVQSLGEPWGSLGILGRALGVLGEPWRVLENPWRILGGPCVRLVDLLWILEETWRELW